MRDERRHLFLDGNHEPWMAVKCPGRNWAINARKKTIPGASWIGSRETIRLESGRRPPLITIILITTTTTTISVQIHSRRHDWTRTERMGLAQRALRRRPLLILSFLFPWHGKALEV